MQRHMSGFLADILYSPCSIQYILYSKYWRQCSSRDRLDFHVHIHIIQTIFGPLYKNDFLNIWCYLIENIALHILHIFWVPIICNLFIIYGFYVLIVYQTEYVQYIVRLAAVIPLFFSNLSVQKCVYMNLTVQKCV